MGSGAVALACGTVFLGAVTQRMTGLGFALVAAPLLVAVLGPTDGVLLGNILSAVMCVIVLATAWRHTRWRRAALMTAPALIAIPAGAWVVHHVPPAPLTILVGSLALVAVLVTAFAQRFRLLPGRAGAVTAGALAGFMNVTAGVGGPALAIHSISERWNRETFLGTGQVFLLVINCLSIATKRFPTVSGGLWLGSAVALAAGAVVGHFVSRLVPGGVGRVLVLALAAIGSASALVRGIRGL
jgi:uncharacterized membrane protein YfcA